MDDKVFNLLEKVYIELQETKKELKQDIINVENRITKVELKIENNVADKISSLYEAQMGRNERLSRVEEKLEEISQKVDKHDI